VARSAGVIGAATLASRVLGLARDVVLANVFAARITDAFFVAFTIPNLFRRLVGEGTLTGAFVPIFTGWLEGSAEQTAGRTAEERRSEAQRAFNATWTLAALVGAGISVAGIVFADPLVRVFAPGFLDDPAKFELCVKLLRICFPYILLLSVFAVAMGALNALGHFFVPAIAPVVLNACIIAAALLGRGAAEPIVWVAVAVVLAGAVQVLVQFPPLRARSLHPRPVFEPGHPLVRRLLTVMAPAVLGASVYQFNLLVVRFLSSFLGDGAVSYLFYADRLLEFPLGVFVFAIGTASLPSLSRLV
jgi:putative peptidoglycan lipid II flippase